MPRSTVRVRSKVGSLSSDGVFAIVSIVQGRSYRIEVDGVHTGLIVMTEAWCARRRRR
jgi:hypothetical protein